MKRTLLIALLALSLSACDGDSPSNLDKAVAETNAAYMAMNTVNVMCKPDEAALCSQFSIAQSKLSAAQDDLRKAQEDAKGGWPWWASMILCIFFLMMPL
jgi:hypothetical protein